MFMDIAYEQNRLKTIDFQVDQPLLADGTFPVQKLKLSIYLSISLYLHV